MSEIENIRYEFDQRERQEKINFELLQRIEKLEKWTFNHEKEGIEYGNDFEDRDDNLQVRLEKIESLLEQLYSNNQRRWDANIEASQRITELEGRIKESERFQDITHAQYQKVITGKIPHKCPVCDGSAGVKHPLTGLLLPACCHACEGKGFIWE